MKLTPLDIHHKEFRRAIRGYKEDEVDAFLDEVAEEFERVFKENIDLKENVEQAKDRMDQYENIEQTLQNTLLTAQKSAEELQTNARKEAELILRDAELKAKDLVQRALSQKQQLEEAYRNLQKAEAEFRASFRAKLETLIGGLREPEESEAMHKYEELLAQESASRDEIMETIRRGEAAERASVAPSMAPQVAASPPPAGETGAEAPASVASAEPDVIAATEEAPAVSAADLVAEAVAAAPVEPVAVPPVEPVQPAAPVEPVQPAAPAPAPPAEPAQPVAPEEPVDQVGAAEEVAAQQPVAAAPEPRSEEPPAYVFPGVAASEETEPPPVAEEAPVGEAAPLGEVSPSLGETPAPSDLDDFDPSAYADEALMQPASSPEPEPEPPTQPGSQPAASEAETAFGSRAAGGEDLLDVPELSFDEPAGSAFIAAEAGRAERAEREAEAPEAGAPPVTEGTPEWAQTATPETVGADSDAGGEAEEPAPQEPAPQEPASQEPSQEEAEPDIPAWLQEHVVDRPGAGLGGDEPDIPPRARERGSGDDSDIEEIS